MRIAAEENFFLTGLLKKGIIYTILIIVRISVHNINNWKKNEFDILYNSS